MAKRESGRLQTQADWFTLALSRRGLTPEQAESFALEQAARFSDGATSKFALEVLEAWLLTENCGGGSGVIVEKSRNPVTPVVESIESWLLSYASMPREYALVLALWAAMTHIFESMDAVPYLVISSLTKRSGKTLLGMDLLRHLCRNPEDLSGLTGPTLYRTLKEIDGKGSVFIDEAETASGETAGLLRTVLNVGYKKGQTIKRTVGRFVEEFPTYAPKCFILIGDVYDTLRDRAIVLWVKRGSPDEIRGLRRASSYTIEPEAAKLRAELAAAIGSNAGAIIDAYRAHTGLAYLPARDEEIWLSLFSICAVLAPGRVEELGRIASDLAVEKTQRTVKYSAEAARRAEDEANAAEYSARALVDLQGVFGDARVLSTAEALQRLRDIPTAPWRRYKGDGLTPQVLAALLASRRVAPKVVRLIKRSKGEKGSTKRGYSKADVDAAVESLQA